MILGVDVSGWNTSINWKTLYEGGVRFAIVKLTQGTSSLTNLARDHVEGARKAGILVGAYHWNDPMLNDNQQTLFFASQLDKYDIHLAYVDVEQYWQDWNEWYKQSITKFISDTRISQSAYNVMTGIRNLGYNGQIYTRWSFITGRSPQMKLWIPPHDTWYAHYPYAIGRINANWQDFIPGGRWYPSLKAPTLPVSIRWKLWQFSGDKFILPGTGGSPIDLNFFPGTEAELYKFFTGQQGNTELPNPEPEPIPTPQDPVVPPTHTEFRFRVLSQTLNIRSTPSTLNNKNIVGSRVGGEIIRPLEIKVILPNSVWVRDSRGWSAMVHENIKWLESVG